MLLVRRRVRKIPEREVSSLEKPVLDLREFRGQGAWILLGEPGAGKSKALEVEAEANDGLFISIAEFLSAAPEEEWRGKALFLDGLDEIRASGSGDSILLKVRAHLKQLGNPPFRITCRAADWFGSTDQASIANASPDGQLAVLVLEPLSDQDVIDILRENHGISAPETFVKKAGTQGLADLLQNPQTLGLLAQAIRGEQWPETRQQTFELACENLAAEASKKHRDILRSQALPNGKLLDATGQLCAALLLSDKTGIALDPASANERFPALEDFSPPDLGMARGAVRRTLFRPSPSGEERIMPSHRSIAEFLAARWLGRQIDDQSLPLGRILNLLLGMDGRTVAGLRGLYGWLALHCQAARRQLIEADPLTVIVYGDVKPMSKADKQHILAKLRQEAERHTAFRWDIQTADPFGNLADTELVDDFISVLESPDRSEAAQAFVDCILDIIAEGEPLPGLAPSIKKLVVDDSRWGKVRTSALQIWLESGAPVQEALSMLDAITSGQIADNDDELSGLLLSHLYPQSIEPAALLRYLHIPKTPELIGNFVWFWGQELPKNAPETHIPILLDQLATRSDLHQEFHIRRMANSLLVRALLEHGEHLSDERLFVWLGIGADELGEIDREEESRQIIATWLEHNPARYKAILARCFKQCENRENPEACLYIPEERLHGAAVPEDIGLWHLMQASQTANDALAEKHLSEAVSALIYQRGNTGLTLEHIETWGENHPEQKHWLQPLLAWEITPRRQEQAKRAIARKQQQNDSKRARTIRLSEYIEAICDGTAKAALLHELAAVWLNYHRDIHGNTPLERFDSYCENGREVLAAAESGFLHCPERGDLPSVAEIIEFNTQQREHFIRQPCLIGMELRWRDGIESIESLADDRLRCMVAFRLTYGGGNTPDWLTHLVDKSPELVAEILIDYASASLKSGQSFIDGIYSLTHSPNYGAVASIAATKLLERFPLRSKSGQLRQLEILLKAALQHAPAQLAALVETKSATKSLDVAQKVYWLTAAMLLNPEKYEAGLWKYIGNSWMRANHLSSFLGEGFRETNNDYELSARSIGKLIELMTPHAELEWPRGGGFVNEAMRRGDHIRGLVTRLGSMATDEAAQEIERLLALPGLRKLKFSLENSRHQLRLKQREKAFRFPALAGLAQILANREPTSTADMAALALDHLDDIAREIRRDNSDQFRRFWTEADTNKPKSENSCRDVLLEKLKTRLGRFGIDCQPEGDYFNDKRADIRLSYRNEFELPIEIKRDSNDSLWTALHKQLIGQYAIAPKASGHGIYLVLWFGGKGVQTATDGNRKPQSPDELQSRLAAQLDPDERRRVFVRVIDVSWPV